jgi:hypothetical protein
VLIVALALAAAPRPLAAQDTTRTPRDSVRAQLPVPPQADTALRDTLAIRDSVAARRVPRDTIQPPLAHAEAPVLLDLAAYRWTRDSLWAGGVVTVADLLDRVPGAMSLRVGWLGSPSAVSYLGDVARVRIFLDGLELDALVPRDAGVLDLTTVQLWTLEEVRIERGATELRVYLRTWRVERTTPSTRADILTGDQQTNQFRLFFGRRYSNGAVLQAGGQQVNTRPPRRAESSDELSLMSRVGWAGRRGWSLDGFVLRSSMHRGAMDSEPHHQTGNVQVIPTLDGARLDAYLRAGYGDPDAGVWGQVMAGALGFKMESAGTPPEGQSLPDSTRFHSQYLATGGITRGAWRASAAHRIRIVEGKVLQTPSLRAGWESRLLAVGAFAEEQGRDSTSRVELSARSAPLRWLSLSGSVGRQWDARPARHVAGSYARGEGEVRVGRMWVGAGMLRRDPALLEVPSVFGPALRDTSKRVVDAGGTATFLTLRGTLYKSLKADVLALQWAGGEALYRPQFQVRSDLYIATTLPRRFPSGNFGMLFGVRHQYRGASLFPDASGGTIRVSGHRTLDAMLEFRIVDAVLTYQYRNLLVADYSMVPQFPMFRQTQYYGIRWYFWN